VPNVIESTDDDIEPSGSREIHDNLALTQTQINTKCPVTMMEMTRPVRNIHCGHSYDFDVARELIRNRQQSQCPVAGCINDNAKFYDQKSNEYYVILHGEQYATTPLCAYSRHLYALLEISVYYVE